MGVAVIYYILHIIFEICLWMVVAHSSQIKPSLANITLFSCVFLCFSGKSFFFLLYIIYKVMAEEVEGE